MNDDFFEGGELDVEYPIIPKLSFVPAVLITDKFASQSAESAIANVPWDAVIVTSWVDTDFGKLFKAENKRIVEIDEDEQYKDIVPSKRDLPIIHPKRDAQDASYWKRGEGSRALKAVVGHIFAKAGVVFINNAPAQVYSDSLNALISEYRNPRNSIYFLGDVKDETAQEWHKEGYAVFMCEGAERLGNFYSLESEVDEENTHLYIRGALHSIRQDDVAKIFPWGNLLTAEELECGMQLPKGDVPYAFRQFLDQSVGGAPNWFCYSQEAGFHLKRQIEEKLIKALERALQEADRNQDAKPVLLCGQAYSGKTNVLCSVAYQIFGEHQYPVIYMPYVSEINENMLEEKLDYLLKEIEKKADIVVPTLIVWDSSCRQQDDLKLPRELLNKLRHRGRQVQMLCSSYELRNPKKYQDWYRIEPISAHLSEEEKEDLGKILQQKGRFSKTEVDECFKKFSEDPHFLASLYRFKELRKNMVTHVNRESDAQSDELVKVLMRITKQSIEENFNNSMAILLDKLEIGNTIADNQQNSASSQKFVSNMKNAVYCVALCTFYGCAMPIALFLRLLGRKPFTPSQIYTAVLNHTLLREQESDDFELLIRSSLEAKLMLSETEEKKHFLDLLVDIIKNVEICNRREIELVRKLVQSIGPNCKFINRNDYSLWDKYWRDFDKVWAALADRRRTLADVKGRANAAVYWSIKLLPQELSLMREYYQRARKEEGELSEAQKVVLNAAYELAKEGRDKLPKLERPDELLEANIWVEYYRLSDLMSDLKKEITPRKLFDEVSPALEKLAMGDNRYVQQNLLELGLKYYRSLDDIDANAMIILGRLCYWCSCFDSAEDPLLQLKIAEIYRIVDRANLNNDFFEKLVAKENPAAIYLWALEEKRRIIDKLPPDRKKDRRENANAILQRYFLDEKYPWALVDEACAYLSIEMLWMSMTGLSIFPLAEKQDVLDCHKKMPSSGPRTLWIEKQCVGLSRGQWTDISDKCEDLLRGSKRPRPELCYLSILAALHLQKHNAISLMEDRFKNPGERFLHRQWYLICDFNGYPLAFTGHLSSQESEKHYLDAESGKFRLKRVYFRPRDLGLTPSDCRSGRMIEREFYLSLSFSGLQACPKEEK